MCNTVYCHTCNNRSLRRSSDDYFENMGLLGAVSVLKIYTPLSLFEPLYGPYNCVGFGEVGVPRIGWNEFRMPSTLFCSMQGFTRKLWHNPSISWYSDKNIFCSCDKIRYLRSARCNLLDKSKIIFARTWVYIINYSDYRHPMWCVDCHFSYLIIARQLPCYYPL